MRALAVLLLGCTPEARPYIEIAPPQGSAPLAIPSAAPTPAPSSSARGADCTHEIRVTRVDPETPTCTVYGLAAGVSGLLEAPCQGDGAAMARFGVDITFNGGFEHGVYHLEREWTEAIGDGCEWRFAETITGTGTHLTVQYRERIVQSGSKCYRPCGATGQIDVR